jgi:hypothetical protein
LLPPERPLALFAVSFFAIPDFGAASIAKFFQQF